MGLIFCISTFYAMDKKTVNSYWPTLEELKTISPAMVARLASRGIDTPRELLGQSATEQERVKLEQELKVAAGEIVRWKKMAELAELKGMGTAHANLLVQAGIEDIPSLAKQNPATLYRTLLTLSREKTTPPPREAIIRIWINAADKNIKK